MKAFSNYDKTQAYGDRMKLPVGGYVLKILDVKYQQGSKGVSDQLILSFDVAEGEQKGFYQKQYKSQEGEDKKWKGVYRLWVPMDDGSEQDERTKRKFKTAMNAFEDSNDGFHWDWDETKLKNKLVGAVFNDKEWELNGKTGFFTNCYKLIAAQKIRDNDYTIPDPTYLKNHSSASTSDDFVNVPEGTDEELPF